MPTKAAYIVAIAATLFMGSCAAALAIGLHQLLRTHDDPVEMAVWHGDLTQVISLVDAAEHLPHQSGIRPGARASCRALLHAASYGRLEIVEALLERQVDPKCGFDPACKDWSSTSPLEQAVIAGHRATIERLIDQIESASGATISEQERRLRDDLLARVLLLAAGWGDAGTTRGILERAPQWRESLPLWRKGSDRILVLSANSGNIEVLRLILEEMAHQGETTGDDPRREEERGQALHAALVNAARWRQHEMVEMLLSEGASLRGADATGVMTAAILSGDVEMVQRMLDAGAPPDSEILPSLTIAMAYRFHDIARLLVERGADPNRRDRILGTPLHASKRMGIPESSRLLRELGAVEEIGPWVTASDAQPRQGPQEPERD